MSLEAKIIVLIITALLLLTIGPLLACNSGGDVQYVDATPIDVATPE